jgi:hypothetical protein
MFKSRRRSIIIPQSEHARLAGFIAQLWGNAQVNPPPVDPAAFTLGVTLHDRGYGHLDTMAIGEVADAVWLATQRRGILMPLDDPVADTIALLHIRRLLAHSDRDGATEIINLADERIAQNMARTSYTSEDFARADHITRLCDSLAFDFCFEELSEFERPVFSQADDAMQPIRVTIADSHIRLHPWPLSVPELRGFILGYALSGYPDHLQPVMVPFTASP